MAAPVPVEDVRKARPERGVLPALDAAAVDVRRVRVPLVARVPHAEAIRVAQRRRQVDIGKLVLSLYVVEFVKPRAGCQDIWVCACTNLGLSPAGTEVNVSFNIGDEVPKGGTN